jgi:hypothetical protein
MTILKYVNIGLQAKQFEFTLIQFRLNKIPGLSTISVVEHTYVRLRIMKTMLMRIWPLLSTDTGGVSHRNQVSCLLFRVIVLCQHGKHIIRVSVEMTIRGQVTFFSFNGNNAWSRHN